MNQEQRSHLLKLAGILQDACTHENDVTAIGFKLDKVCHCLSSLIEREPSEARDVDPIVDETAVLVQNRLEGMERRNAQLGEQSAKLAGRVEEVASLYAGVADNGDKWVQGIDRKLAGLYRKLDRYGKALHSVYGRLHAIEHAVDEPPGNEVDRRALGFDSLTDLITSLQSTVLAEQARTGRLYDTANKNYGEIRKLTERLEEVASSRAQLANDVDQNHQGHMQLVQVVSDLTTRLDRNDRWIQDRLGGLTEQHNLHRDMIRGLRCGVDDFHERLNSLVPPSKSDEPGAKGVCEHPKEAVRLLRFDSKGQPDISWCSRCGAWCTSNTEWCAPKAPTVQPQPACEHPKTYIAMQDEHGDVEARGCQSCPNLQFRGNWYIPQSASAKSACEPLAPDEGKPCVVCTRCEGDGFVYRGAEPACEHPKWHEGRYQGYHQDWLIARTCDECFAVLLNGQWFTPEPPSEKTKTENTADA